MWTKLMSRFSNSETIFLARLQMLLGIAWSVAAATDWSPFVAPRWMPLYVFVMGVVTELARRARAEDV